MNCIAVTNIKYIFFWMSKIRNCHVFISSNFSVDYHFFFFWLINKVEQANLQSYVQRLKIEMKMFWSIIIKWYVYKKEIDIRFLYNAYRRNIFFDVIKCRWNTKRENIKKIKRIAFWLLENCKQCLVKP